MIQEEENYRKLYRELKSLSSHIKINNEMQTLMIKSDYNDDAMLPQLIECLERLKQSMSFNPVESKDKKKQGLKANAALVELRYVQDMNAQLLKLKQKVLLRFAECVQTRVRALAGEGSDMSPADLVSEDFTSYLEQRLPILRLLAEISSASSSNKTLQQELQGLVNRLYRVISEEFQTYMSLTRFIEILANYKAMVSSSARLDWPAVSSRPSKSLQSFMPSFISLPSTSGSLDESMAEFMLRLLVGLVDFDNSLFTFF